MITALIWVALFAATAVMDLLAAKWSDSLTKLHRANISAVHEAVGFLAGFTVYNWTHSVWTIIPCIAGAWVGSWWAGDVKPELDPEFVDAVADAVALANEHNATIGV